MKSILLVLVLILSGCGAKGGKGEIVQRPGEPDVVMTEANDKEMDAAIAEARRTLPQFLKALESPGKRELSVKVALATPDGGKEHIWVADVAYDNGKFTGVLDNDPLNLPDRRAGDKVTFAENEVSDWLIFDEAGNMTGGYTVKLLMSRQEKGK